MFKMAEDSDDTMRKDGFKTNMTSIFDFAQRG